MQRQMARSGRYRQAVRALTATCLLFSPGVTTLADQVLTPFEQFAVQRGTRVVSAIEVGRIEGGNTRAVVTAVVLENSREEPDRMRGLRVDFRSETAADRVYLAEDELPLLKQELDMMVCAVARARQDALPGNRQVTGIASCRPSNPAPPAMCPGWIRDPDGESFGIGTRNGLSFRFPDREPGALRDAIAAAMTRFGLDGTIPAPEPVEFPEGVLDMLVVSATSNFPQLANSPGLRLARYSPSGGNADSATLIFEPFAHTGDLGHAMLVYCQTAAADKGLWQCAWAEPRGYLRIPGQEREVVITGDMSHEDAWTLIRMARQTLADDPEQAGVERWRVSYMRPPNEHSESYSVVMRDDVAGDVAFEFRTEDGADGRRFTLSKYGVLGDGNC